MREANINVCVWCPCFLFFYRNFPKRNGKGWKITLPLLLFLKEEKKEPKILNFPKAKFLSFIICQRIIDQQVKEIQKEVSCRNSPKGFLIFLFGGIKQEADGRNREFVQIIEAFWSKQRKDCIRKISMFFSCRTWKTESKKFHRNTDRTSARRTKLLNLRAFCEKINTTCTVEQRVWSKESTGRNYFAKEFLQEKEQVFCQGIKPF